MNTKNITITVISSLIVLMIFSLILTGTYSLYSGESISSNKNEFTTGALSITANHKSSVISINNILPIPDSEGIKTNPYIFTITNTGTIDYNFSVKLVATGVNNYSSNYLKIKVDNDNITTLQSTGGIIKSNITLPAGESIDISIRIWLDEYTPNTEIGKSFESEIKIDGENTKEKNLSDYIINLYNNSPKSTVTNNITYHYAKSVNLMNDGFKGTTRVGLDEGNIRYYGANPNNFIMFNNELWRIIGIFDGKTKIIKYKIIYNKIWDSTSSNNWSRPADLNTYLNGSYYNSITTKNKMIKATWHLGGNETSDVFSDEMYKYEREKFSFSQHSVTNYVGVIYTSDYGYASDFNLCTKRIKEYSDVNCKNNNWIFNSNKTVQSTLTIDTNRSFVAYILTESGMVDGFGVNYGYGVAPTVYLSDEVSIISGTGTENDPYIIS